MAAARKGGSILFSGHHGSWFKVRLPSQNFKSENHDGQG